MPPRIARNHTTSTNSSSQINSSSIKDHRDNNRPSEHSQSQPTQSGSGSGSGSRLNSSNSHLTRHATEQFAQAVHLVEGFADTLDAIPPSLTRSLSDLKELDAVLSAPLKQVHSKINKLLDSIGHPDSMRPDQRLSLLRSVIVDIDKYKLGGEDKIRVANGTCESLSHHISQLDTTQSHLISSLPSFLESRLPAPSFPTGYPKLSSSLRSRPMSGAWSDHQSLHSKNTSNNTGGGYHSPPLVQPREFINFDEESLAERTESSGSPFDSQAPLPKRPRIAQSVSTNQLGFSPNHHSEEGTNQLKRVQSETGSGLLDQHMMMLSQPTSKRRIAHEDSDPKAAARTGKLTAADSKDDSKLNGQSSNGIPLKNKRSRVRSNMTEVDGEESKSSSLNGIKQVSSSQSSSQANASVTKKRTRKNAQTVPGSLTQTDQANDPLGAEALGGQLNLSQTDSSSSSAPNPGSTSRKATGSRHVNGLSKVIEETTGPPPPPAKRAYTKRNGTANGVSSSAKTKRGGGKKMGAITEAGQNETNATAQDDSSGRKSENADRTGKAGIKESGRAEVLSEGNRPGRPKKTAMTATNGSSSAPQDNSTRGERESKKYHIGAESGLVSGTELPQLKAQGKNKDQDQERITEEEEVSVRVRKRVKAPLDEDEDEGLLDDQSQESNHTSSTKVYCICKGEVFSERMVACDNSECPIEWFHYQCAGLTEDPIGTWFCSDCLEKGFGPKGSSPTILRMMGNQSKTNESKSIVMSSQNTIESEDIEEKELKEQSN